MSTATKDVPSNRESTVSEDEAELRRMIAAWSRALEARDVDGLVAGYAPDVVQYDLKPPYKLVGPAAIRRDWKECLPCFPKVFKSEHRELKLVVGDGVAFCHGLHHIVPVGEPDHPAGQTWIRVTTCYRKVDGRWRVVHEHVSMPFDCTTGKISAITDEQLSD